MKAIKSKAVGAIAIAMLSALVSAQALATPIRIDAQEFPVVVAAGGRYVPGDVILGEALIVVLQGHHLRLFNEDSTAHSITSLDQRGGVPLFDTGMVSPGRSELVGGVNELAPGDYRFTSMTRPANPAVLRVVAPQDDVLDAIREIPA
jgi:hypothetical protein